MNESSAARLVAEGPTGDTFVVDLAGSSHLATTTGGASMLSLVTGGRTLAHAAPAAGAEAGFTGPDGWPAPPHELLAPS